MLISESFNPITRLRKLSNCMLDVCPTDELHFVETEDSPELKEFFQEVRNICNERISANPSLFYTEHVVQLHRSEWMIRRYMNRLEGDQIQSEDASKTAEAIIQMMLWKKEMRVKEISIESFPREFFMMGIFGQGSTPTGEPVIHINVGIFRKDAFMTPYIKEFVISLLERIEDEMEGKRINLFLDFTGVSLKNTDIEMTYWLTVIEGSYFRRIIKKCIVYAAPWYLSPFISFVLSVSPRCKEFLIKVDKNNLFDVLNPEEVPVSLGGRLETKYDPPEGCPSARRFSESRNIEEKDMNRCLKKYGISV